METEKFNLLRDNLKSKTVNNKRIDIKKPPYKNFKRLKGISLIKLEKS